MESSDYPGLYMAAEAAYNAGDAEPFAALFAESFTINGAALTGEQWRTIVVGNVANGMQYRPSGLSAVGPFLMVSGTTSMPDGSSWLQVGVLRFGPDGLVTEFSLLQDTAASG